MFLVKAYWGGGHLCSADSEEEYFDFEESCEQSDRTLRKGEEIGSKESAKEELTDLQLKFEIKEVCLFNSIWISYMKTTCYKKTHYSITSVVQVYGHTTHVYQSKNISVCVYISFIYKTQRGVHKMYILEVCV